MEKKLYFIAVVSITSLLLSLMGCKPNPREDNEDTVVEEETIALTANPYVKLYVENSGSMFGYVASSTEFKDVIRKIIHDKDFDYIDMGFNFINGDGEHASKHFKDKDEFETSLSKSGMKVGNTKTSDISGMLNTMLTGANGDTITILVSDGIYDIGSNNYDALRSKGDKTRETVRRRLYENKGVQTMVVKMQSHFDGSYCYATKSGSLYVNDKRPYYIWIFGNGELLNEYFPDDKVSMWSGYNNHARLQVTGNSHIPAIISSDNSIGKYRPSPKGELVMEGCKALHGAFAFSIIVDYETLAYSDDYLMDINNYICDNEFRITNICKASEESITAAGVTGYKKPFIITLETNGTPRGKLNIELKNNKPAWIDITNADNENQIDTEHTFGFSTLMEGIIGAYTDISVSCPATFSIILK